MTGYFYYETVWRVQSLEPHRLRLVVLLYKREIRVVRYKPIISKWETSPSNSEGLGVCLHIRFPVMSSGSESESLGCLRLIELEFEDPKERNKSLRINDERKKKDATRSIISVRLQLFIKGAIFGSILASRRRRSIDRRACI